MFVGSQEGKNLGDPLIDDYWVPVLSLRHRIVNSLHLLVLLLDFGRLTPSAVELFLTLEGHRELMILEFANRLLELLEAPLVQIHALTWHLSKFGLPLNT